MNRHTITHIVGWTAVGILLFIWQENHLAYNYYYMEQFRLFHYSLEYALKLWAHPGGAMEWMAGGLIQYFDTPKIGSLVTTLLLLLSGIGLQSLWRRLTPQLDIPFFYLFPPLLLLFAGMDFNYHLEGTLAFALTVGLLHLQMHINRPAVRLGTTLFCSWGLFHLAGPAVGPFALCAVLLEGYRRSPLRMYAFLLIPLALLPAWCWYQTGLGGEARNVFLPDAYTNPRLPRQHILYAVWAALPLLLLLGVAFSHIHRRLQKGWGIALIVLQLVLCGYVLHAGNQKYNKESTYQAKELDYHCRRQQWDHLLANPLQADRNTMIACYQNLALAQKGILANKALCYRQCGNKGLWLENAPTVAAATLMSDLYYAIGHIALAQRYAFEGMIASERAVNPRLLLRLIQTNLVYGHYAVAEKYIRLLEDTRYQEQATAFRRFLYDDEAVEADPQLGQKRRCTANTTGLANMSGPLYDLLQITRSNPDSRTAFEYLGMYLLFQKDMASFQSILKEYIGAVPKHGMPIHFQEAVVLINEAHPEVWEAQGVTPAVAQRFEAYKKTVLANKRNPAQANLLRAKYGDTYWFYFMYHK